MSPVCEVMVTFEWPCSLDLEAQQSACEMHKLCHSTVGNAEMRQMVSLKTKTRAVLQDCVLFVFNAACVTCVRYCVDEGSYTDNVFRHDGKMINYPFTHFN